MKKKERSYNRIYRSLCEQALRRIEGSLIKSFLIGEEGKESDKVEVSLRVSFSVHSLKKLLLYSSHIFL